MALPLKITFLGGLGEIGRNCAAFELDGRIMLLDCGLMFPDNDMLGIDLVLPDFTYLRENADRIEGCVLTHGHEDHVGALSYALADMSFPLIGSALTLGLARGRIEEARLLDKTDFITVTDGERRKFGPFDLEFLPITHSVPHGFATAFHTPQGTVLHSGDFKIDLTPVDGRLSDLSRIGGLASGDGVRLLLSDSTNADEHGHSTSETTVGNVLYDLMHDNVGSRVITACFASHLHRIQQIADAAVAFGRKIAPLGRSMRRNVAMGREMGIITIAESDLVDIEDVNDMDPGEVCVICTGSQGEPMSALALLGSNDNRWLKVQPDDTVIFSSHPIPGNESAVTRVIDNLVRLGATVVHSGIADVHATGHAKQEELKLFLSVARPECFVPVHGEYRHLVTHSKLAAKMGVDPSKILVAEDGDQIVLDDDGIRLAGQIPAEYIYVHGTNDVDGSTIAERQVLGNEGIVSVIVCVDIASRSLVGGPLVETRGWVNPDEGQELFAEIGGKVSGAVQELLAGTNDLNRRVIEKTIRRAAGQYVNRATRRRPMILPVVVEA